MVQREGTVEAVVSSPAEAPNILVFGATGSIGQEICAGLRQRGFSVTGSGRKPLPSDVEIDRWVQTDPLSPTYAQERLIAAGPYNGVCWAQGANLNDSVYSVDIEKHLELYNINCVFVVRTLQSLLSLGLLVSGARLCVVSSIWQSIARQHKLSYCMTKAALQGLVLSASVDLARDGHTINAVLPGALDTPMTHANLGAGQVEKIAAATYFGRLATTQDVVQAVSYLCHPASAGVTGQFIAIDNGFSHVRIA